MLTTKNTIVKTDVITKVFENFKSAKILDVLGTYAESIKPLVIGKTIQKIKRIGRTYQVITPQTKLESEYMRGWCVYVGTPKKNQLIYLREDEVIYDVWDETHSEPPDNVFDSIDGWNNFVCSVGTINGYEDAWGSYHTFDDAHEFLEITTTKGSFKLNAALFNDEAEFWELIASTPPNTEKQVQYALKAALEAKLDDNVELEVKCDTGRIDVLAVNSIWEVKHVKHWLSAIGQVLRYSHNYPNHKLGICLFGEGDDKVYAKAYEACKTRGIHLITDFGLAAKGFRFPSEQSLNQRNCFEYDDDDNYNPYDDLDSDGELPYDPEYKAMNPEYGHI